MTELQDDALASSDGAACTSCEQSCQEFGRHDATAVDVDAASSLPTAEDCAQQLSSILNNNLHDGHATASIQRDSASQGLRAGAPQQSAGTVNLHANDPSNGIVTKIGSGVELYTVKICIERCHELCRLLAPAVDAPDDRRVWFSYRFMGAVVQSELFVIPQTPHQVADGFVPMIDSFRVQSSLPHLRRYFSERKNATLRIHLCTDGEVLGTSLVPMRSLLEIDFDLEGRTVQSEHAIQSRRADVTNDYCKEDLRVPRVAVRLCVDRAASFGEPTCGLRKLGSRPEQNIASISLSTSTQTKKPAFVERASSPIRKQLNDPLHCESVERLDEKESQLNAKEAELAKREKEMYQAVADLEKKRGEWESWRHRQELEWHEKLRSRESAMMRTIDERASKMEKERLASVGEYEKLESRLRKALMDVEAKERQLKDIELGHANECTRRLAELDLKERLLKEELKHSVQIERAKVNAAVEEAVSANKKVSQLESELEQMRERHRSTPEVSLLHQVAELKGQLADSERRIEAINAEKNQVTADKERFRSNVHKLAKALRQEREKATKRRESNNQQVRLQYDASQKLFLLGGEGHEITRILSDLNKISQVKGTNQDMTTSPPMPSPQPSRPASIHMSTPSQLFDLDGMIATPV